MANDDRHNKERQDQRDFSTRHAEEEYRVRLTPLRAAERFINDAYFEGKLQPAHLSLAGTPPRSLCAVGRTTGYGGRLEIRINAGLAFGTNRRWVVNPWPNAQGTWRFVEDLLLRCVVRQYVMEILGTEEPGYRGYGPLFTVEANRIGLALGLEEVIERRRNQKDDDRQIAPGWPHCCRPAGYYGDDVTPALLELAACPPGHRPDRRTPPPVLNVWQYVLYLLGDTGVDLETRAGHVKELATTQRDILTAIHNGSNPVLGRFETGQEMADGSPISWEVEFNPAWLTWEGGTAGNLLRGIHEYRDYAFLPVLGDALEDAGCAEVAILDHCRAKTVGHDSRCWVLNGLLALLPSPAAIS